MMTERVPQRLCCPRSRTNTAATPGFTAIWASGTSSSRSMQPGSPTVTITGNSDSSAWARSTARECHEYNTRWCTGISKVNMFVDGNVVLQVVSRMWTTVPQHQCRAAPIGVRLGAAPVHDGDHELLDATYADAATAPTLRSRRLRAEGTPAAAPRRIFVAGRFRMKITGRVRFCSWTNPARARTPRSHELGLRSVPAPSRASIVPDFNLRRTNKDRDASRPRADESRARLWLEDAAGDPPTSYDGAAVVLSVADDEPPSVTLAGP